VIFFDRYLVYGFLSNEVVWELDFQRLWNDIPYQAKLGDVDQQNVVLVGSPSKNNSIIVNSEALVIAAVDLNNEAVR
jgi:hypothetical protein